MKRLLVVLVCLMLTGCHQVDEQKSAAHVRFMVNARSYLVTLEDGTRCFVHVSGGVHCNWNCKP